MKMPEKIEPAMFAPCGMNCLVCYKHCYHKKKQGILLDSAEKEELKQSILWIEGLSEFADSRD